MPGTRKNNKAPEKKIQLLCKSRLDYWVSIGVCLHYDDLSNAGRRFNPYSGNWIMNTQKGRPDLVAYILYQKACHVFFLEIKNPKKYDWSEKQKEFCSKFNNVSNVNYSLIFCPRDIDRIIENLTGHQQKILDSIKWPEGKC